jgi:hypothetical protein
MYETIEAVLSNSMHFEQNSLKNTFLELYKILKLEIFQQAKYFGQLITLSLIVSNSLWILQQLRLFQYEQLKVNLRLGKISQFETLCMFQMVQGEERLEEFIKQLHFLQLFQTLEILSVLQKQTQIHEKR